MELTKLRLSVDRLPVERYKSVPHARKEAQVIIHHAFTREQQQWRAFILALTNELEIIIHRL